MGIPCDIYIYIYIYIYIDVYIWVHVMRLGEGRILKLVMLEALELGKGVRWVKDLQSSLEMFGWSALMVEALSGLSMRVVKHLVKDIA